MSEIQAEQEELDLELGGEELEWSGAETDSDLVGITEDAFRAATLAHADWTVETILGQLGTTSINLNPKFQRRDAWNAARKSTFIESLILGLPIPELVLAEENPDEATFLVIDGKQRLLTLQRFFSDDETAFRLRSLTALPQLNGLTLHDIDEDPVLNKYGKRLRNRTIRTVVIRNFPSPEFLHLVFHRLNHQTLPLSPQELRQALIPGEFTTFAENFAADSTAINSLLGVSQGADFRMRDVELLVRYFAFRFRIEEYNGNLKRFLDDTCDVFNQEWSAREAEFRQAAHDCDASILATQRIFGEHAFRRFNEGQWERRFNRAVFDVMAYYFADPRTASAAFDQAAEVESTFRRLSTDSRSFSAALTTTTKTLEATHARFSEWGAELGRLLSLDLRIPRLNDGRLRVS